MPAAEHAVHGPAEPARLDDVHGLLAELWAAHPEVPDTDRFLFETSVAEIAANIVEHTGADVEMSLELEVVDRRIEARFCDDGSAAPIDIVASARWPDDELATRGRGLASARDALDRLTYVRDGDVNRWTLARLL